MKNLIGHPMRSVVFRDELARCGIEAVPALTRDPELGIDAEGLADVGGGFVVRVARAPVYAVVQITPRLPYAAADAINDVPHVEDGGAYSTHDGRLGGIARANGHVGGLFGADLRDYGSDDGFVELWHVDAIGALHALVVNLRRVIAERGLTAEEARAAWVKSHTRAWILECVPVMRSRGEVARIVREALHTDADLDARDPRVVALRAEFPRKASGQ